MPSYAMASEGNKCEVWSFQVVQLMKGEINGETLCLKKVVSLQLAGINGGLFNSD